MTIHEVSKQLFNLSIDGFFNGEQFTRRELEQYIKLQFRSALKLKNRLVMEIALQDKRWLFTVNKYNDSADGYDYTIPETEAQEIAIWNQLVS